MALPSSFVAARAPKGAAGLILLLLTAGLAGCGGIGKTFIGQDLSAVGRGRSFAEVQCATCHAVGRGGDSPKPSAPPFGTIRLRYNELSLERELQAIGEVGHYGMPVLRIEPADRRDLIAYIESLSIHDGE
jgi:cytochrome c